MMFLSETSKFSLNMLYVKAPFLFCHGEEMWREKKEQDNALNAHYGITITYNYNFLCRIP